MLSLTVSSAGSFALGSKSKIAVADPERPPHCLVPAAILTEGVEEVAEEEVQGVRVAVTVTHGEGPGRTLVLSVLQKRPQVGVGK